MTLSVGARLTAKLAELLELALRIGFAAELLISAREQIARFAMLGIQGDGALQPTYAQILLVEIHQGLARQEAVARRARIAFGCFRCELESLFGLAALEKEIGEIGVRPIVFGMVLIHQIERLQEMLERFGVTIQRVVAKA